MGLFDFFKRKKVVPEQNPIQQRADDSEDIMKKLKDMEKNADEARAKRDAEIEEAINKVPEARQYRLNYTQQESTVHDMTITEFTPISKKMYVAFDLETTGVNHMGDEIVEIAAVRVENGIIIDEYQQLVDPGRPMPAEALAVNHITDDMLRGKPKIHQVLPSFLAFIGDDVLVAHNAPFDIRFLCQACMRNRFRTPASCFNTMNLARYWPEAENKKLATLAAAAGIEIEHAHRAMDDTKALVSFINATNERRSHKKK